MPENISPESLSKLLSGLLNDSGTKSIPPAGEKPSDSGDFSLPPELLEKLPQVMSVLSGMGIGNNNGTKDTKGTVSASHPASGNRKALLRALRPYLSPHRQAVIDSLISFEGISGILENLSPVQKKEEKQ